MTDLFLKQTNENNYKRGSCAHALRLLIYFNLTSIAL